MSSMPARSVARASCLLAALAVLSTLATLTGIPGCSGAQAVAIPPNQMSVSLTPPPAHPSPDPPPAIPPLLTKDGGAAGAAGANGAGGAGGKLTDDAGVSVTDRPVIDAGVSDAAPDPAGHTGAALGF